MDDLERYGDYNETEDDIPKGKSPIGTILKIFIAIVCIGVVGILGFRVAIFNHYPDSVKNIYFNTTLTEYYNENGKEIEAISQNIRYPYDDSSKGRFFCDNLIVIKDAGQLQVSLRFNVSVAQTIEQEYGIKIDPNNEDTFKISLERDPIINSTDADPVEVGELTVKNADEFLMYRYYKLVFDGLDFADGTDKAIEWLRLKIEINGVEMKQPYYVLIYENHEDYSAFTEYKISDEERPE